MNKPTVKRILLFLQITYSLFLFPWIFFAMIAIMMFDAPGSKENFGLILLYTLIWLYPIGLLASVVASWITYQSGKLREAVVCNSVPLIWVLPITAVLIYANVS